jgi:lysozyme family protein
MKMPKSPFWVLPAAPQAGMAQTPAATAPSLFLTCLPYTLAQECPRPDDWSDPANFSNDPHDPGGATMCGIIQTEYDAYRRSLNEPIQDVRLITQAEGDAIYQMNYWQPYSPKLPVGLDLSFFDAAVNMGVEEAIRILQVALGIGNDGKWGPQTAAAATGITDVVGVIKAFTVRRQAVYEEFSTFVYFGTDWTRRTTAIGAESVSMANAAVA